MWQGPFSIISLLLINSIVTYIQMISDVYIRSLFQEYIHVPTYSPIQSGITSVYAEFQQGDTGMESPRMPFEWLMYSQMKRISPRWNGEELAGKEIHILFSWELTWHSMQILKMIFFSQRVFFPGWYCYSFGWRHLTSPKNKKVG